MATKKVPASKRSIAQDEFAWTIPGTRKKIRMRSAAYLTFRQAEALAKAVKDPDAAAGDLILKLFLTDADRDLFRDLPRITSNVLFRDWMEDGEEVLGKS